ncbi:MAG: hypothetical protein RIR00_288 [Pseudomonadota bacterium]
MSSTHQQPKVLWLTGLSGAGKSTLAEALAARFAQTGGQPYILDGDKVRFGLNADLGFSDADRKENLRRAGHVARMLADAGVTVIAAFISPFEADRQGIRSLFAAGEYLEVYLSAPLAVCEQRDPKGLYKRARAGLIPEFTGIDSPYEPPPQPELVLDTGTLDLAACVEAVWQAMRPAAG